jgi:hypothetical protein
MRRPLSSTLAALGGAALGYSVRWMWSKRRESPGDLAMRRLTTYFGIPIWIGAGFVDYLWHRHTRIESTSGLKESLTHMLMMLEAGPAVLAGLFLEINAGVLAAMIALSILHEATVLWDLSYTASRRVIPAGEHVTHTFLESPPFLVTTAAIATHWEQFQALLGRGGECPEFGIHLQRPPISSQSIALIFVALTVFGALPHADELRRCADAERKGLVGHDTPAYLPEAFSKI